MTSMKIDFDIVHLAHLARLNLTAGEEQQLRSEIERILEYVQQLQAIETTGVTETAQVTGLTDVLRLDQPNIETATLTLAKERRAELLAAAPETEDNLVKVPVILGDE